MELQIDALRGLREGTVMRAYPNETTPEVEITEPVLLSFDVTADTSRNTQGEAGVTVDSVPALEEWCTIFQTLVGWRPIRRTVRF